MVETQYRQASRQKSRTSTTIYPAVGSSFKISFLLSRGKFKISIFPESFELRWMDPVSIPQQQEVSTAREGCLRSFQGERPVDSDMGGSIQWEYTVIMYLAYDRWTVRHARLSLQATGDIRPGI